MYICLPSNNADSISLFLKVKAYRVYTVALTTIFIKHVPQVSPAGLADDLGALHAIVSIFTQFYVFQIHGVGKAGPASAGIKLGLRGKKFRAADGTSVHALAVLVPILTRKCWLGASLARHVTQLGRQFFILFHTFTLPQGPCQIPSAIP